MKDQKLAKLFSNNKQWKMERLSKDRNYFKKLSIGQTPEFLYIGCSDSRVSAEEFMGLQPGELFVHRNIANLVISTDTNVNAVVQFAVEQLKVQHVIVCGHYECAGVKAAMNPSDMGQLNIWLQTLRDVCRLHQQELAAIADYQRRFDRLVELNVLEQCINLLKIDHIQRSWNKTGFPKIHGWVFDVRSGNLIDLKLKHEEILADFRSIYDLKPQTN